VENKNPEQELNEIKPKPEAVRNFSVDYELVDYGDFSKLERFGNNLIIRPDQTAIEPCLREDLWEDATCIIQPVKTQFTIKKTDDFQTPWTSSFTFMLNGTEKKITFALNTEASQQVGLFPEHAEQWSWIAHRVAHHVKTHGSCNVLNLFGYTGAASLAAASAGAEVCHIDSASSALAMGKQSQALSGIEESKIRWLKDDVITFLQREVKRGSRYDAIIMDPPAFGRGPDGETFVIEDDLSAVIQLCGRIVSKNPLFIILNQYPKNIPLEYCELLLRERFANMQLSKKKLNLVCNQDGRQIHCATGITLVPISKKKHG